MRDFAGPLVRLAFHDSLSFDASLPLDGFGGVDGIIGPFHGNTTHGAQLRYRLQHCLLDYANHPYAARSDAIIGDEQHGDAESCEELAYSSTHTMTWASLMAEAWCEPYKELSWSDCWVFASTFFVEASGGPRINLASFRWGRKAFPDELDSEPDAVSCHPGKNLDFDGLYECFVTVWGFTVAQMVALGGAHTVGKHFSVQAPTPGTWDDTPHVFDNRYFQRIVNANAEGVSQFQDGGFAPHGTIAAPGDPDADDEPDTGHQMLGFIWRNQPPAGCDGYAPNSVDCTGDVCYAAHGEVAPMFPESSNGSLVLFNADMAFYWNTTRGCSDPLEKIGTPDPALRAEHSEASRWTAAFAANESLFFEVFEGAWLKMIDLGNDPAKLAVARHA